MPDAALPARTREYAEGRRTRLILGEGARAAELVDLAQHVDPLSVGAEELPVRDPNPHPALLSLATVRGPRWLEPCLLGGYPLVVVLVAGDGVDPSTPRFSGVCSAN